MNKKASRSPLWRKRMLLPLILAVTAMVIHFSVAPAVAFDQGVLSFLTAWGTNATALILAQASSTTPNPPAKPQEPIPLPSEPTAQPSPGQEAPKPLVPNAEIGETSNLDNESCMYCHNPDILQQSEEERLENVIVEKTPLPPRPKLKYSYGELSLSLDDKKFGEGVHGDMTCVDCHNDIAELPHKQRLQVVDCSSCHEESVEQEKHSAHGEKALAKGLSCVGCHDVHYGQGKDSYAKEFQARVCEDCHRAYGMDTAMAHGVLYEYGLHRKAMGCLICHQGEESSAHTIPRVMTKVASCGSCHTKHTVLSSDQPMPMGFFTYITQVQFINEDVLKKYGYVIGAHRIPLFDTLIVLVVLGPVGLAVLHGALRFLTRRTGPIELSEERIFLHPLPERTWHWLQAICIVMLIITGIMLHWPEWAPNWFDWAVTWHNCFGWGAVIAWLFWLIYNLVSRRITHYIPRKDEVPYGMIRQAQFYGYGIFKHEPHPYAPSEDNKFNPLQKIAYLKFQLLLFPLLLITGLLYMYPTSFEGIIKAIGGTMVLGMIHYLLGALFASFLVAHLYLATTGETLGENFKAMVWGYGIKSDHGEHRA